MRILGVVILFHPDADVAKNINSYLAEVEELMVIDNTQPPAIERLGPIVHNIKVSYHYKNGNRGIAQPLNQAAQKGVSQGYDWLLTMDQDSYFEEGALEGMKRFASQAPDSVGIISPVHQTPQSIPSQKSENISELRFTMTSGNLLNLRAYDTCGPFEEKLFIDSVDHEYCLRLRKNGFRIIRMNRAILYHELGDIIYHRFLFFRFKTTRHSALRRYYILRNRLYVMSKYAFFDFKFFRRELKEIFRDLLRLFFEDQKVPKFKAMLKGVFHFVIGRYGKL